MSKIQKWGKSQGIRIPKVLLENSCLEVGEQVQISLTQGNIVIEPANKIRNRYKIKDLAKKMPKNYKAKEENWGIPVGKESLSNN